MEGKLAAYRRKKQYNELLSSYKQKLTNLFTRETNEEEKPMSSTVNIEDKESKEVLIEKSIEDDALSDISEDINLNCCTVVDIIYYACGFILWVIVYVIFIKFEFGTVYLILSIIVGMYINTRTSPKKANEISAYSVFNKNCKSIDGTLKGEQFEREMGYRMH